MNQFSFEQLNPQLQASLQRMNITEPSEVQSICIPHALQNEDLLVQAATGSGKTLAFLLPVLEMLEQQKPGKHFPAVLILAPTRELCIQITGICRKLLENREGVRTALLTGGTDMNTQIRSFSKGADIVVGTPARVLDHMRRHTFKPKKCTRLILDEADVMLSMGFENDVRECIAQLPLEQRMLFSATWPDQVKELAEEVLIHPFKTEIVNHDSLEQKIDAECICVSESAKIDLLKKILKKHSGRTIIISNKRVTADFISRILKEAGFAVSTVHSESSPDQRRREMNQFRNGETEILAGTDAVSRGIDIPDASLVISYDLPDVTDTLVHRFGRTARGGSAGKAVVFITPSQSSAVNTLKEVFPDLRSSSFTPRRTESIRSQRRMHSNATKNRKKRHV